MSFDHLAREDALRLAVLLAGDVHAVRIDEGTMQLHALTARGEARVPLHPDTRAERYLAHVREALAGHAMGSPGGYPVHLRRWTRSGHANPKNLDGLLRLGEPEAVTAVALSVHLTDALAQRAWWAQPGDEIARSMLGHPAVQRGAMGPVLARHLLEHLAFEEDADTAIASVRAIAAAGLLDAPARERLWRAAPQRPHYLIGWLEHAPTSLPAAPARALPAAMADAAAAGDSSASLLVQALSAEGQGWLRALLLVLERLPTHDASLRTLELVASWLAPARLSPQAHQAPDDLMRALHHAAALSATARADAEAVLGRTTAVGPLMRRHLAPVLQPLVQALRVLRGTP